ncbi:MAG: HPr kinase/phosphorylase [Terriglobales bacterium]
MVPASRRLPWEGSFWLAGVCCQVATNCPELLGMFSSSLPSSDDAGLAGSGYFRLRCWVDESLTGAAPWPKPYFRGLKHLVFASFGLDNALLLDLRSLHAVARISAAMARDRTYWQRVLLPVLLTVLGGQAGVVGVHAACVVRDGRALLLAGGSGAGKSTLALALAQRDFQFVADDRTYVTEQGEVAVAWPLPGCAKLRPEAARFFPALAGRPLEMGADQEFSLFVPLPAPAVPEAGCSRGIPIARVLVLQRQAGHAAQCSPISSQEILGRWDAELMAAEPSVLAGQRRTLARVCEAADCRRLSYAAEPHEVARYLDLFCQRGSECREEVLK